MEKIKFDGKKIIGMIHVPALPGTPGNRLGMTEICTACVEEARIYRDAGVDYIMMENMHDIPYLNSGVGPEITAAMAVTAAAVKREVAPIPVGVQVLAAANKEALAVAKAANLDFVRCEGFVFGHIADEGYIDGCAGELLRYRKMIDAEHIAILTDIKKKHASHHITSDVDITETAKAAEFFLSDGLIISGASTGEKPNPNELKAVKKVTRLPVLLGSGITPENISQFQNDADGFIIGTYFKKDGIWQNPPDPKRIKTLLDAVK